ncbi:hypothetical protein PQQ51_32960 [Paraburkholderia xenovorans]|uniref:hypothetical protein n=1 Tax=Paraburkholderia xenovorans TaxID=36873 RepID=UPI0038BADC41
MPDSIRIDLDRSSITKDIFWSLEPIDGSPTTATTNCSTVKAHSLGSKVAFRLMTSSPKALINKLIA